MKDSGLISHWFSRYKPDVRKCGHEFSSKAAYAQAKMMDFIGIFLLLFFGITSATIAFICEHMVSYAVSWNTMLQRRNTIYTT